MNFKVLKPRQALNKAFLKVKPNRIEIELFKASMLRFIEEIDDNESEEFHKNLVSDFLKDTYYRRSHFINTKGRSDLVIHNGKSANSSAGVIIEAKKPSNKSEMINFNKVNVKAFHELTLYYLRERITNNNLEIKNLIVTNFYEWYIFDVAVFERLFAQNKNFVKQFIDFDNGRLADTKTEFFYKYIVEPFIENTESEIEYTCINILDYGKPLRSSEKTDDNSLIVLYKLLSPEHLLKLPFANDSNSLDKGFYSELLHIIGLSEVKSGNKKLIERMKAEERNTGTFIEDAITQLDSLEKISRINKPEQFGSTHQEKLFNIALELTITWINRILFLKLLEAQLIKYNKGDKSYSFLNSGKIKNYNGLNSLFFQVLARIPDERIPDVKHSFEKVPYLNSSLFEPSEIEHVTMFVSNLTDGKTIPVFHKTVLKDGLGKKIEGKLPTLDYLFKFLDAYDFSSEGAEEIQEENKLLINASVLGLIFEKINGYRDGSFFTPGYITMYMCRETIRRAIVQKFNEIKKWNCSGIEELYNKIENRNEANDIINSIKICDPAVGSGHFLVSALNEIIAVKSSLKILQDSEGSRLKEYLAEVVNDELVVTDEDGELFEYNPGSKESQRVQEALFHEKHTIIENCLFGVDINPNSVKICRLRLWIELLKNAYYKNKTGLETLPNIDINIKCGNSLISRYPFDANLKKVLSDSKWNVESYRVAVSTYRNTSDKNVKREMEQLILKIKQDFTSEIRKNDPLKTRLDKLANELYNRFTGNFLFEPEIPYNKNDKELQKKRKKEKEKLENEIKELNARIDSIKSNKVFENAFEWRFEFPEVLNDYGDFTGFDIVLGNPPYIRQEELGDIKIHLQKNYKVYDSGGDIFSYFYELGYNILRENGLFSFINNAFDKTTAGKTLREYVANNFKIYRYIDFTDVVVFDEATTYPVVIIANKSKSKSNFRYYKFSGKNFDKKKLLFNEKAFINIEQDRLNPSYWNFLSSDIQDVLIKINRNKTISDLYGKCYRGIITGLNEAFVTESRLGSYSVLKDMYDGKDLKKWSTPLPFKKIIVFESKSTSEKFGESDEETSLKKMKETFPEIFRHLEPFKEKAAKRFDKGEFWWELRNCAYYDLFERPKIIFPNLQNSNKFAFDETGAYLNAPAVFLPANNKSLLAVLNSKVVWYFLKSICVIRSGGYIEVKPQYFEQIPIPDIDKKTGNELINLVNTIINKGQCQQSEISELENQINKLVYKLYGLTDEEIKIVEKNT